LGKHVVKARNKNEAEKLAEMKHPGVYGNP